MSTHAVIAAVDETSLNAVYVHLDGYPAATGWILQNYYPSAHDTARLLAGGSIASLGISPERHCHDEPGVHPGFQTTSFRDQPPPAYRGNCEANQLLDTEWGQQTHASWLYVHTGDDWQAMPAGGEPRPLAAVMAEHDGPVRWSRVKPDGETEYLERADILADCPPRTRS